MVVDTLNAASVTLSPSVPTDDEVRPGVPTPVLPAGEISFEEGMTLDKSDDLEFSQGIDSGQEKTDEQLILPNVESFKVQGRSSPSLTDYELLNGDLFMSDLDQDTSEVEPGLNALQDCDRASKVLPVVQNYIKPVQTQQVPSWEHSLMQQLPPMAKDIFPSLLQRSRALDAAMTENRQMFNTMDEIDKLHLKFGSLHKAYTALKFGHHAYVANVGTILSNLGVSKDNVQQVMTAHTSKRYLKEIVKISESELKTELLYFGILPNTYDFSDPTGLANARDRLRQERSSFQSLNGITEKEQTCIDLLNNQANENQFFKDCFPKQIDIADYDWNLGKFVSVKTVKKPKEKKSVFLNTNNSIKKDYIHGKSKFKPVYESAVKTVKKKEKKQYRRERTSNHGSFQGIPGKLAPKGNKKCWRCDKTSFKTKASLQQHMIAKPKRCLAALEAKRAREEEAKKHPLDMPDFSAPTKTVIPKLKDQKLPAGGKTMKFKSMFPYVKKLKLAKNPAFNGCI